jgi:hypothetical protein
VKDIKQTSQKDENTEGTQKEPNTTFNKGMSRKRKRYQEMKLPNGPS